jgi:hypothetical protein
MITTAFDCIGEHHHRHHHHHHRQYGYNIKKEATNGAALLAKGKKQRITAPAY